MEMNILQTLGLLASIFVGAIGIIKWLLTKIDTSATTLKAELTPQIVALSGKIDTMNTAINDVRVGYTTKQELATVVQMFQNAMDKTSAENNRAIDSITSRIDNLINIVTNHYNGK